MSIKIFTTKSGFDSDKDRFHFIDGEGTYRFCTFENTKFIDSWSAITRTDGPSSIHWFGEEQYRIKKNKNKIRVIEIDDEGTVVRFTRTGFKLSKD